VGEGKAKLLHFRFGSFRRPALFGHTVGCNHHSGAVVTHTAVDENLFASILPEQCEELREPVSDFEQRAADFSVDHPLVLENYRSARQIAVRQTRGQASTEDLRQAMIHYRTLFEELVGEPDVARAKAAP